MPTRREDGLARGATIVGPWEHTATGRKWSTYCSHRMGSGGFDFPTFGQAVAYCQQIADLDARYGREYRDTYSSFLCWIDGPGGRITMNTLRPLLRLAPAQDKEWGEAWFQ